MGILEDIKTKLDEIHATLEGQSVPQPQPEPEPTPEPTPSGDYSDLLGPGNKIILAENSIAEAKAQAEPGDHIYLKRGVTYTETFGQLISGTDESTFVLGAYGEGADPKIVLERGQTFINSFKGTPKNILLADLNIVVENRTTVSGGSAVRVIGFLEDFTMRRCLVSGFNVNLVFQSYQGNMQKNITIEECVVRDAYNTPGNGHSQGIYTQEINGLRILDCVFSHNGWNGEAGNATMFNHSMYLSHCTNTLIKSNSIANASSIGIKFTSNTPGGCKNVEVLGNYFRHGEVGISMGGNKAGENRFHNARIENNVFDAIGATEPTGRSFAWGIDLQNHVGSIVKNNTFKNMPGFSNQYLVRVNKGDTAEVTMSGNVEE